MAKTINSVLFPNNEKKERNDLIERKKKFREDNKRFNLAKKRFNKIQSDFSATSHTYIREETRFLRERERFFKRKKELHDISLRKALPMARIDLEPFEVRSFSNAVFAISILILLALTLPLILITQFDLLYIILSLLSIMLIPGPLALYIESYPFIKAKRFRSQTVGKMPQVVHHLSLSMRLSPSLDRAVRYAAKSADEPMASELQKVLWDVYMREHSSIEEAFLAFAHDWNDWDEDFSRALYMIRSAALEKENEGINRVLDKANDIILQGTKGKLKKFASELKIPSLVLFAIGIMLPLLVAILLPVLGIGKEWTWVVIGITNVLLPLLIFIYTYYILGKRPEMRTTPDMKSTLKRGQIALVVIFSLLIGGGFFLFGLHMIDKHILWSVLLLWSVTIPIILYCFITNLEVRTRAKAVRKLETEYPEALFQLGNRIAEGKPFETALGTTASAMKNTLISNFFKKMSYNLRTIRLPIKDILFGSKGLLKDSPAKTIKNTMLTVVEAVKKEPNTAGKTIILISNYLAELHAVEKKMKEKMHEVTGMMSQTAVFIAPVVIGFTVVLYKLMSVNIQTYEVPSDMDVNLMGMGQDTIAPLAMSLALGLYLVQLVIIISIFVSRVNHGRDNIELKNTLATYLLISMSIYSFIVFTVFLIGGSFIPEINNSILLNI